MAANRPPSRRRKIQEWMKFVYFMIGLALVELYATFGPSPPHR